MPLFYFSVKVHNGYKHRTRMELPKVQDVHFEAVRFAGEMIRDMGSDLKEPTVAFELTVTDGNERPVYGLTFSAKDHLAEDGASAATT